VISRLRDWRPLPLVYRHRVTVAEVAGGGI
jgi:hypothetical protein